MDAVGDELLAVAEHFELVVGLAVAVRGEHLAERRDRTEHDEALGGIADAHADVAVSLSQVVFHDLRDVFVVDVDVDGRRESGVDADVAVLEVAGGEQAQLLFGRVFVLPAYGVLAVRPLVTPLDGDDDVATALEPQRALKEVTHQRSACRSR